MKGFISTNFLKLLRFIIKKDCWDNAVAESFFALLKKYVYQTIFKTRTEAQLGVFDSIET